jgi:hypothetical protein
MVGEWLDCFRNILMNLVDRYWFEFANLSEGLLPCEHCGVKIRKLVFMYRFGEPLNTLDLNIDFISIGYQMRASLDLNIP